MCGFISLIIQSCKDTNDSDENLVPGYSYFPMQVGDSLIYDVQVYDKDLNEVDSSYQLLERVESAFEDNEGRPTLDWKDTFALMSPHHGLFSKYGQLTLLLVLQRKKRIMSST